MDKKSRDRARYLLNERTPGRWILTGRGVPQIISEGVWVCEVCNPTDTAMADAELIAEAPELLEAALDEIEETDKRITALIQERDAHQETAGKLAKEQHHFLHQAAIKYLNENGWPNDSVEDVRKTMDMLLANFRVGTPV